MIDDQQPDDRSDVFLYAGDDGRVNVKNFVKDETVWLTR